MDKIPLFISLSPSPLWYKIQGYLACIINLFIPTASVFFLVACQHWSCVLGTNGTSVHRKDPFSESLLWIRLSAHGLSWHNLQSKSLCRAFWFSCYFLWRCLLRKCIHFHVVLIALKAWWPFSYPSMSSALTASSIQLHNTVLGTSFSQLLWSINQFREKYRKISALRIIHLSAHTLPNPDKEKSQVKPLPDSSWCWLSSQKALKSHVIFSLVFCCGSWGDKRVERKIRIFQVFPEVLETRDSVCEWKSESIAKPGISRILSFWGGVKGLQRTSV